MANAPRTIALAAAETSGDQLGAHLICGLRERFPDLNFIGIGGDAMAKAGCRLLYRMERIGLIGFDGLLSRLGDILRVRRDFIRHLLGHPPTLYIGLDAPDFNLPVERRLRAQKIPCVQYVSPTVWAWRRSRMRGIGKAVDLMLLLYPFELPLYNQAGIPAVFVGHPTATQLNRDREGARQSLKLDADPLIALLPGSRASELGRLTAPLLHSAHTLLKRFPDAQFIVPPVSPAQAEVFTKQAGALLDDLPLHLRPGEARTALQAADCALIASGTASLEAALAGCPHVVVYRLSAASHWLLRRLAYVERASIVNHLLPEADPVPELLQSQATAENMAAAASDLLDNPDRRAEITKQFEQMREMLKRPQDAAAEAVSRLLEEL